MILSYICSLLFVLTGVSASKVLYPEIDGVATLSCECPDGTCNKVFWYHVKRNSSPEFILYSNIAGVKKYGERIDHTRFIPSHSGSSKGVYTLRINNTKTEDAGLYSCLLSSEDAAQGLEKLMPAGYYLKPGEKPPTGAPPKIKPLTKSQQKKPACISPKSPAGCKGLVLWTGGSVLLVLAVVLISTLYYFSRLPRKCRHRFAKTNQLR